MGFFKAGQDKDMGRYSKKGNGYCSGTAVGKRIAWPHLVFALSQMAFLPACNLAKFDSKESAESAGSLNSAPLVHAQVLSVNDNESLEITLTGEDADGDSLSFEIVTEAQHGVLTGTAPQLLYTPSAPFSGVDSFTIRASDGKVSSELASVAIQITHVNLAPTAPASLSCLGSPLAGSAGQACVLTEAAQADPEGDPVSYQNAGSTCLSVVVDSATGSATFTAPLKGASCVVKIKAFDGELYSGETSSNVIVGQNNMPVAAAQSVAVVADATASINLTGSDQDSGDALSYSVVTGPSHGTLTGTAPSLVYQPTAPFNETDSFTFKVNDGTADSEVVTVSIAVSAPASISSLVSLLGDYLTLPLATGVATSIDLPLTTSTANPPADESGGSHALTKDGSPTIQSSIVRPGKTYAAYTPGNSNGSYGGKWNFGIPTEWNSLNNRSFAMQAWVYLPTGSLTTAYEWSQNIIYGGGGPDSGAPRVGVSMIDGGPKLFISGATGRVSSSVAFPYDTWVHVSVTHDHSTTKTAVYMNGFPVARSTTTIFTENGPNQQYNLGAAEYNGPWSMSWRGYISNFRLYTNSAEWQAGCFNPGALNYDPNATYDNGSCTYPALSITFADGSLNFGESTTFSLTGSGAYGVWSSYGSTIVQNGSSGTELRAVDWRV